MANDFEKIVIDELDHIWQTCGDDLLGGDESATISGADLGSIVADLYAGGRFDNKEAHTWWLGLPREDSRKIIKKAFPYKCYGY